MNPKPVSTILQRVGLALSVAITPMLLTASAVVVQQSDAEASSHREAPLTSKDPYADNTDTYVFIAPDDPDRIVLAASWIPFEGPEGGPNYFEWDDNVLYEIHVDNDGDAKPDVTYALESSTEVINPATFLYNVGPIGADGANWNRQQRYSITEYRNGNSKKLLDNVLAPPVNIGSKSTGDFTALEKARTYTVEDGKDGDGNPYEIDIYAGQTDDAFWVDLQVFDLLTLRGQQPPIGYETGNNDPVDSVAGFNVHSLVVEVPIGRLTQGDEPVLGVWATASRKSMRVLNGLGGVIDGSGLVETDGDFVQVSRLGMPLVNEAVLPYALKDAFNTLKPEQDLTIYTDPTFGPILQKSVEDPELGNLLCGLYGVPLPGDADDDCATDVEIGTPRSGRGDIFDIFLTGMVLANEFTINTAGGPVTLPASFNINRPEGAVPAEMIRINTTISGDLCAPTPSRLGVLGGDACGFPNGRRLFDDTVEIELLAVAGAAYGALDGRDEDFVFNPAFIAALDDGIDANDMPFRDSFPFYAMAQSGQEHIHQNPMVDMPDPPKEPTGESTISRIMNPIDDAEEKRNDVVILGSRDLELGELSGRGQTVGLRFDVEVPQGANITDAYIQFVAEDDDEIESKPATLTFRGEATAMAKSFVKEDNNITDRTMTAASVEWANVPAWGTPGEAHWTPNLATIVQEIVNIGDWEAGQPMVLTVTGTGTRSAWSANGKAGSAPLLYVEYTMSENDSVAASAESITNNASNTVSSTILGSNPELDNVELLPDDDATEENGDSQPAPDVTIYLPFTTK